MSTLLRAILFTTLMLLSCALLAQPGNEPEPQLPLPDAAQDLVLPDSALPADTALFSYGDTAQLANVISKKKERRLDLPKGAPAAVDTLLKSRIFRYNINVTSNDVQLVGLDTSLFYFRTDYPFFRADVGAIFLGNLGSPAVYYDFFKRKNSYDFIFQQPYDSYFFTPSNVSFYNTTTAYTVLYYDWAGSKSQQEDQLRVLHAQNITHDLNFVLMYNTMGTKGQYPRQHIKNRSFNLGLSYLGKYYKANLGYIFNEVEAQENGGIADDRMITDTVIDPQMNQVRLQNGKNHLRNHRFYLTHSVDLPVFYFGNDSVINNVLMGRIGHALEYSTYSKVYSDDSDSSYYKNSYFNATKTRDSLGFRNFENRFFVQLRPLRAYIFESLTAGVGYKSMNMYMFDPSMYLTGTSSSRMHTTYAYAAMAAWYKQYFHFNFFAKTNFSGYKSGDYELGGDITLSAYPIEKGIHLKGELLYSGTSPDIFIENYSTNHYRWSNSNFERTAEFRIGGTLSIPYLHCEIGASQSIINDFVYFDEDATLGVTPRQYRDSVLSITALSVSHKFEVAGFNFNHRALLQFSSNQAVVSLPLFSVGGSYYFEHDIVKNVLRMQLGIDWQYSTSFNGYAYDPSIGMFYNTSQVKQGNYLWADAFIAFRWKRATPFVKCEHVGQGLLDWNTNYFSAVHYPRNARVFKFGLSWKFFD